jgi:hypothetical protein
VPEELIVGFNPMAATQRVASCASMIRSRLMWLLVSVVICVWIYIWKRDSLTGVTVVALFAAGIGYSVLWVVISLVSWIRAKAALGDITPGVATKIDRNGIWMQSVSLPWSGIDKIVAQSGRFGRPATIRVYNQVGEAARVPINVLDVMPGTIDASIRAFSNGAHWIDTSKLGN